MATMSNVNQYSVDGDSKTPGAPGAVVMAEDPAAPSKDVSSKRQSVSDLFTIVSTLYRRCESRDRGGITKTSEG